MVTHADPELTFQQVANIPEQMLETGYKGLRLAHAVNELLGAQQVKVEVDSGKRLTRPQEDVTVAKLGLEKGYKPDQIKDYLRNNSLSFERLQSRHQSGEKYLHNVLLKASAKLALDAHPELQKSQQTKRSRSLAR